MHRSPAPSAALRRFSAAIGSLALASALGLVACAPASPSQHGSKLYATMGCLQCHGATGAGGPMAPPLTDIEQHWDRARLAAYLESPRAFLEKDARLAALKQRYSTEMPALGLSEADRLAVADHLLELSATPGP